MCGIQSLCRKWHGKRKGENWVENLIRVGDEYGAKNLELGLRREGNRTKSGKRICTVWSGGDHWARWGILETEQ